MSLISRADPEILARDAELEPLVARGNGHRRPRVWGRIRRPGVWGWAERPEANDFWRFKRKI